jgi:hypothetical protein
LFLKVQFIKRFNPSSKEKGGFQPKDFKNNDDLINNKDIDKIIIISNENI